ncbi:hypothetical protein QFW96_00865 [Saccharopolyspora sp. TS4A08]|uniref:Uncharacterized protein n=1 Tax=Saccharopolyspora ipomoeae TaxID=3042027 RepID=A0ABT6PGL5_9PSEU|nr:hypothetical protein [Saccharopolyspora sp. TS4A08]MDI2027133.1 hypothetical protein [Saccharopolyspora sp. TS4A08]
MTDTPKSDVTPPRGARAVVQVTPNPVTEPNQEVTITGHCGGGTGLRAVFAGLTDNQVLEDITIVEAGPEEFEARGRLRHGIGHGAGPVVVDCGGELGTTILVTRVKHE